jgi:hypothetical protein
MIAWNPLQPVVLMVTAMLLLTPGVARAQGAGTAQPHGSRWWVGGGGGFLASRSDCTNCDSDRPFGSGPAVLFQGGLRVSERLLVGGEILSTARTIDGVDFRHSYLLAVVQARPFATHGFFLKGGYGMAIVRDVFQLGGVQVAARPWGMGLMYGAGWVFREGRRISVAPVAAQYVTTVGDLRVFGSTAQNVVINGWFVGAVLMVR